MKVLFSFLSAVAAATHHDTSDRRLIAGALRLLTACAIAHPRWYASVGVPLARLAHHPGEDLSARAREELDRLRSGFSNWIGPNVRRALDPESGAEYGWKDVVVFAECFAAREAPLPGVPGALVAEAVRAARPQIVVEFVPALSEVVAALGGLLRPGDLVLTVGAGDITSLGPVLVSALQSSTILDRP